MILVNEVPSHAIMPASEVRSERDHQVRSGSCVVGKPS